MNTITALSLTIGLCLATIGVADAGKPAPSTQTVSAPAYYDANGKLVGPVLPVGNVMLRLGSTTVYVELEDLEPNGNGGYGATWSRAYGQVHFDQPGCTGNAYLAPNSSIISGFANFAMVMVPPSTGKHTLYVAPATNQTAFVSYSYLSYDYTLKTHTCTEEAAPYAGSAPKVTATYDLSTYQLPLFVK